jgi:Ca2+-binding EF-hand superfamily protein
MVRSVSEDKLYDTIEFNEFLLMMSKQQEDVISMEALVEAFK